eukprot:scaffold7647_cov403-Prasinococcus_capsulatus_cf.AAC.5
MSGRSLIDGSSSAHSHHAPGWATEHALQEAHGGSNELALGQAGLDYHCQDRVPTGLKGDPTDGAAAPWSAAPARTQGTYVVLTSESPARLGLSELALASCLLGSSWASRLPLASRVLVCTAQMPFYRITVADAKAPRDGKHIEVVGHYNPIPAPDGNKHLGLNFERVKYWLGVGAQPSDTVSRLLGTYCVVGSSVSDSAKTEQRHPTRYALSCDSPGPVMPSNWNPGLPGEDGQEEEVAVAFWARTSDPWGCPTRLGSVQLKWNANKEFVCQ